jgi:3-hydroxyisobutyrate dehydrogenase-like beta-hydroxyacid dehydrogenase
VRYGPFLALPLSTTAGKRSCGTTRLAAFERAPPLLDKIAQRVIHIGGIGTGSIAKIMHNSASFTLDLVMAEWWSGGVKAGIDAATIVKVL